MIPCYNEGGNLSKLVEHCGRLLDERSDIEVILVDNGSTDKTPSILDELLGNVGNERLRTVRVEVNQGYGFGILFGLRSAAGDVLGWTHADLQTDPIDFLNAIRLFEQPDRSLDIVVKGDRYGRPLRDRLFTWGMAFVEWLILGVRMWDINAQPTVFSRAFYESWEQPPHDFSLDLFVYHEAVRQNLELQRFPVYFGARLSGEGHNERLSSKLKYSWKTLLFSLGLRRHLRQRRWQWRNDQKHSGETSIE